MNFRVFGSVQNSYVDGPGIRMAIFFQGCLHHCPGCHNPGSWPMYGGVKVDTEEFKKGLVKDPLIAGLTLTGGEPFLQPVAALDLARFARSRGLSVWCYSGYTFEEIREWQDNRKDLLESIDVLVDGRFEMEKRSLDISWRGSTNQRLVDVKKSLEKGEVVLYDETENQGNPM